MASTYEGDVTIKEGPSYGMDMEAMASDQPMSEFFAQTSKIKETEREVRHGFLSDIQADLDNVAARHKNDMERIAVKLAQYKQTL